jgi:hypothetical protein
MRNVKPLLAVAAAIAAACSSSSGGTPAAGAPDLCAAAVAAGGSLGCEFWAADLDAYADATYDGQHAPFAIAVANPGPGSARLTLTDVLGAIHATDLAAAASTVIRPQELGFADHSVDLTGTTATAYRLTADRPVAAWQWNPDVLGTTGTVSSADGSLLLPAAALGTSYRGLSWPSAAGIAAGYLAVIATRPTLVTITPSADVAAGGGFAALAAGASRAVSLGAFEILNLEAAGNGDLSGTLVEATAPVAVFGGHEGAQVPVGTSWADHLEEQLVPQALGTTFPLLRSQSRGGTASDLWRIVGVHDGTALTWSTAVGGPTTVSAGQVVDGTLSAETTVIASQPVVVARLLRGGSTASGEPTGDPSLGLVVPAERFLTAYPLAVPGGYASTYLSVVAPAATAVTLDGTPVSLSVTVGGGFVGGRISVTPGYHRVDCPSRCGVEVHGLGSGLSTVFPGGMRLAP